MKDLEKIVYIPLEKLYVGEINVRRIRNTVEFQRDIQGLKRQIRSERKITTPLEVLPRGEDGRHEIVAGSRRFTVMSQLHTEGQQWAGTVPCIVRDLTPEEAYRHSMIENLQRNNLQPYEEALFYEQQLLLFPDKYRSMKELAKALGVSEKRVLTMRSLAILSPEIGRRIRVYVSTSKVRTQGKLLPLSHGLELAKIFSDPRVKRRFNSHEDVFREQAKLADSIYRLDLQSAKKHLDSYRNPRKVKKIEKMRRAVNKRRVKKKARPVQGKVRKKPFSLPVHLTSEEFEKLHNLALSKGISDFDAIHMAIMKLIEESESLTLTESIR